MSNQWIERVLAHSKQKGTTRLVCIILAHLADRNGHVVPQSKLVADLARMDVRNVQLAIKQLDAAGELTPAPRGGYDITPEKSRGEVERHPDGTMVWAGSDQVIVTERRSGDPPERSGDRTKRSGDRRSRSGDPPSFKDLKESESLDSRGSEERGKTKAAPRETKSNDERAGHPAIEAVREILHQFTGKPYYPNKALWDEMIATVGATPDRNRLTDCFRLWVSKGNKPTNIAWALEWYRPGVLEAKRGDHAALQQNPVGKGSSGAAGPKRNADSFFGGGAK